MHRHALKTALLSSALMFMMPNLSSAADDDLGVPDETRVHFKMVVSPGARTCLPNAQADVHIITQTPDGQAEDMFIVATGLPANTGFDFFVIQVPNAPFGLSWYQGDMQTGSDGDDRVAWIMPEYSIFNDLGDSTNFKKASIIKMLAYPCNKVLGWSCRAHRQR